MFKLKDDKKLVNEIKKHKCIYSRVFFKEKEREEAWAEVAKALQRNEAECQNRWANLRARYTRYSRKFPAELEIPEDKLWHLYPYMSFLKGHVQRKQGPNESKDFIDDLKFIEEIRKNDILWNTSNPKSSSLRNKNLTWAKVAYTLGTPENACRQRWSALRRKVLIRLKDSKANYKKWIYANPLQFLLPHMKCRKGQNFKIFENGDDDACSSKIDLDDDNGVDSFSDEYSNNDGEDYEGGNNEDDNTSYSKSSCDTAQKDAFVVNETGTTIFADLGMEDIADTIFDTVCDENEMEKISIEDDISDLDDKKLLELFEVQPGPASETPILNKLLESKEKPTMSQSDSQSDPSDQSATGMVYPTACGIPLPTWLQKQQQGKPVTIINDPFYAALGVFFEKIDPDNAIEFKMDVLAYVHKRFNEFQKK